LETDHIYKVKFEVDTLYQVNNYNRGLLYTTSGFYVYNATDNDSLVYQETFDLQNRDNILFNDSLQIYYLNPTREITSDVFEGLRLNIDIPFVTAYIDVENSDWIHGSAPMLITLTGNESYYFPWDYHIIFTADQAVYTSRVTNTRSIRDENGLARLDNLLKDQNFYFYVVNKSFTDSTGESEILDMVVQDVNGNDQFDYLEDRIFVGPLNKSGGWAGTALIIDFQSISDIANLPQVDDVYQITFKRPFFVSDSLMFKVNPEEALDANKLRDALKNIRVVPNPYIATNNMEPAVSNIYLNQSRRIMFTNVPAQCTIKIFTSSCILVENLEINNSSDDGIAHWNLLSKEGLEVAAGLYFYHIRATATGDEKMGKFAVIK